eukprot:769396-Rhodomonas_salina.1
MLLCSSARCYGCSRAAMLLCLRSAPTPLRYRPTPVLRAVRYCLARSMLVVLFMAAVLPYEGAVLA